MRSKKNKTAVFRYVVYSVEIVLLWVLQSTPFLIPGLFGAKPLLLLVCPLTIASKEEKLPSLIFGAVCGVLTDISATNSIGLFAVGLTLICYLEAHLLSVYFRSNIFSVMLFSLAAVIVLVCAYFLVSAVLAGIPDSQVLFFNHYISRIVYTFLTVIPLYALNSFVFRRLG